MQRWNEIVKPDDIVYHLGDVGLGDTDKIIELVKHLNGHIYLAYGNHDSDARLARYKMENLFEDIQMGYRIKHKDGILILTHYPTIVKNTTPYPRVWNLHGHTHDIIVYDKSYPYKYHVGMDATECYPLELNECINELKFFERKNNNAEV